MREIPGYPGYLISERGEVFCPRLDRLVTQGIDSHGYPCVNLFNTDRQRFEKRCVSRLLGLTFIPNPENKPFVCHRDDNHLNNELPTETSQGNLYWGDHDDNTRDAKLNGRYASGESSSGAKLTQTQVDEVQARLASGESNTSIARDLPVKRNAISAIKCGRVWNV